MSHEYQKAKDIFLQALEIDPQVARNRFLDNACKDDKHLRRFVVDLLDAHSEPGNFLKGNDKETSAERIDASTGDQIGPYKLREKIGEGGFGVVYVAEQKEPVSRKVALKVIKPGMDSKDVIARFEAERQALAMMDHPNVAKVFDAGATESGRPYFVMELVHGTSITEFCDAQKLTNRQRLKLFVDVCRAVQHAHQKGIIHRDLKPTNIMVTMADHRSVPKVIDFGVAKALHHNLTDKSIYTGYGQLVGTPMYMSPEQAQMSSLDVDTRSDIYSLGVLLYELLTGTTPFDKESFKQADFDEIRRIIREDDPARPSDRISTLNAEIQSTVSDHRKVDQRALCQSLRGDLDWIVMKTLEKDRTRRYETANGLALDIGRYLNDEPVLATPPSAAYRFRKFARRNKVALAFATVVSIGLVLAVMGLVTSNYLIAQREADKQAALEQADINLNLANKNLQLAQKNEKNAEENFDFARDAVDDLLTKISEETLLSAPAMQPLRQDLLERAAKFYEAFVRQSSDEPGMLHELALGYYRLGRTQNELGIRASAVDSVAKAEKILQNLLDDEPENSSYQAALARVFAEATRLYPSDSQKTNELLQNALAIQKKLVEKHPDNIQYQKQHAKLLTALGKAAYAGRHNLDEAEKYWGQTRLIREKVFEKEPEDTENRRLLATSIHNLALIQLNRRRLSNAATLMDDVVKTHKSLVDENPDLLKSQASLGAALHLKSDIHRSMNNLVESLTVNAECLEIFTRLAAENPDMPDYLYRAAHAFVARSWQQQLAGDKKAALQTHQEMVNFLIGLRDEVRLNSRLRRTGNRLHQVGRVINDVCENLENAGHIELLEKARREYHLISKELCRTFPDEGQYQLDFVMSSNNLGSFLRQRDQLVESENILVEAIQFCGELEQRLDKNKKYIWALSEAEALTHTNLADIFVERNEYSKAEPLLQIAFADWKTLHDGDPTRRDHLGRLIQVDVDLCNVLRELDREPEVAKRSRELEQILKEAANQQGASRIAILMIMAEKDLHQRDLSSLTIELANQHDGNGPETSLHWAIKGGAYFRAGEYGKAVEMLEKALEKSLPAGETDTMILHLFLAMSHWHLGNHEKAREIFTKSTQNYRAGHDELVREASVLIGLPIGEKIESHNGKADR